MNKHTPGPWRSQRQYVMTIVQGREVLVASVDPMYIPEEQVHANALLIAAAPELLKACETLKDLMREAQDAGLLDELATTTAGGPDQVNKACDLLNAAIAKAKGGPCVA